MTVIKPFTTTYNIRGKDYKVTSDAKFDDQGKIIPDAKLDDANKNKALDIFRKDQGYIYPKEIKAFRDKLGFSQKDLANLLGMSPNTIALYELGALPSEANNNLLKLVVDDDENLKELAKKSTVSDRVKEKITNYFNGISNFDDGRDVTSPFTALQLAHWFIVRHSMDAKFDPNVEPMTQMKLVKLLYLAYGLFLAKTKNKLFISEIRRYQWGPLVMEVHEKYNHQSIISDDTIDEQAYKDFIDVSANTEISNLLNYVLDKYGRYTAAYLSKKTHQEGSPWSQTADREIIKDSLIYNSFSNGKYC